MDFIRHRFGGESEVATLTPARSSSYSRLVRSSPSAKAAAPGATISVSATTDFPTLNSRIPNSRILHEFQEDGVPMVDVCRFQTHSGHVHRGSPRLFLTFNVPHPHLIFVFMWASNALPFTLSCRARDGVSTARPLATHTRIAVVPPHISVAAALITPITVQL